MINGWFKKWASDEQEAYFFWTQIKNLCVSVFIRVPINDKSISYPELTLKQSSVITTSLRSTTPPDSENQKGLAE